MNKPIDVRDTIYRAISDTFSVPLDTVHDVTTAADVDGWDSVSTAILFLNIEESVGVELDIARLLRAENVGELVAIVSAQLGNRCV